MIKNDASYYPKQQGLYDPTFEKDACGVGMVCSLKGEKSHDIVAKALQVLANLEHRGAIGSDAGTGAGAASGDWPGKADVIPGQKYHTPPPPAVSKTSAPSHSGRRELLLGGKGRTSLGRLTPTPCVARRLSRSCSIWLMRLMTTP